MFQLGRPDILPVDDFGVRNGFRLAYGLRKMPHPKALAIFGERWSPHRSAAAWYLWRAVELHRAGALPKPAEPIKLPRIAKRLRRLTQRLEKKVSAKLKDASRKLGAPTRAGKRSTLRTSERTALRRSERAALRTTKRAPLRAGKSTPLRAGKSTPLRSASKPSPLRRRAGRKPLRPSR
jgi:hypothetical protein